MPVMPGLVPGIHAVTLRVGFRTQTIASASASALFGNVGSHCGVDGRDKPGHDGIGAFSRPSLALFAYPSAYGSTTAAT
jgi:hypothetical protein